MTQDTASGKHRGLTVTDAFNAEFHVPDKAWQLKSWRDIAKREIKRWIEDEAYSDLVTKEIMKNEFMGPFTKFLYHFAFQCKGCGWGVMIDFNENSQRVFLPDKYYKWMHEIRDEINNENNKQL